MNPETAPIATRSPARAWKTPVKVITPQTLAAILDELEQQVDDPVAGVRHMARLSLRNLARDLSTGRLAVR